MNVTKDVPQTPIVSGVSVIVTTDIPRNMDDVKVTGVEFHRHKFSNTDQHHLILSNPAVHQGTACPWI